MFQSISVVSKGLFQKLSWGGMDGNTFFVSLSYHSMGDWCRTKICPGHGGVCWHPHDVLFPHKGVLWMGLCLISYVLGVEAGAIKVVCSEGRALKNCPLEDNCWNSPKLSRPLL